MFLQTINTFKSVCVITIVSALYVHNMCQITLTLHVTELFFKSEGWRDGRIYVNVKQFDNLNKTLGHFPAMFLATKSAISDKKLGRIQFVSVAKETNIFDQTSGHFPTMSVASKQIRPCFKLCLWQQNQLEQTRHRDGFLAALVAKNVFDETLGHFWAP